VKKLSPSRIVIGLLFAVLVGSIVALFIERDSGVDPAMQAKMDALLKPADTPSKPRALRGIDPNTFEQCLGLGYVAERAAMLDLLDPDSAERYLALVSKAETEIRIFEMNKEERDLLGKLRLSVAFTGDAWIKSKDQDAIKKALDHCAEVILARLGE
jgi:hypothetical protein